MKKEYACDFDINITWFYSWYFFLVFWDNPQEKESNERSAELVLDSIKEGVKLANSSSWIVRKIDIIRFDDSSTHYIYMLTDEILTNVTDVEEILKEKGFGDWDVVEENNGRIWVRKIATFGNNGYIDILRKRIGEEYPEAVTETRLNENLLLRFTLF